MARYEDLSLGAVRLRRLRYQNPNIETLSAQKALTRFDSRVQTLDPGGADRDVLLPAEANSSGDVWYISNAADAAERLIVKEDGDTTIILDLLQNENGIAFCDGTGWHGVKIPVNNANIEDLSNTERTLTLADARIQTLDPGGGNTDVLLPAEADSVGVTFYIANTADAAESLVVKEDSDTTTIVTVAQNERGIVWCDGTTWYGFTAAQT